MTTSRTPAQSAVAGGAEPGVALKVRVPVLRRPPGWGLLDDAALRVRATQLYLACMEPVHPMERVRGAGGCTVPGSTGSGQEAAVPFTPPLAASAVGEPHRAVPASRKGSHWHLLPWGLLLGGTMLLAPWLIWAPLVGGLCLGLLLLQTGMLKRWLQSREPDEDAAVNLPGRGPDGETVHSPLADEAVIQAVQRVGGRRLRWAHSGWMLTAVLVLVGVQAAMLLTTVQIKNREPAAFAGAIRAAHPGRDARQSTAPDAQQVLQPLPVGGVAPAGRRPAEEATGPAEPRRGGTP